MVPDHAYSETLLNLDPGDALLMFTDGAIELIDSAGHELATAGLKELLQKLDNEDVNSFRLIDLEKQLLNFTDLIHLPDDLTLLKVLRRM